MDNIVPFGNKKPRIGKDTFIDPDARIFGDVIIGDSSTVLFGCIVRGDDDRVIIGNNVAILENVIIEAPKGKPVRIGDNTLVSHGATIHGAEVGRNVLVGIGAIILDGSVIEDRCIIGAGSIITPNSVIPSKSLVLGCPGKVVREVTEDELRSLDIELKRVLEKSKLYKDIFRG
jgi:carbonic anhydrase/acetyltransferase-like protein (isoleucine patch superfamily)